MAMILSSAKRTYDITLSEKEIRRLLKKFREANSRESVQSFIDLSFAKASIPVSNIREGQIRERRKHRDRAKLGILFLEGLESIE